MPLISGTTDAGRLAYLRVACVGRRRGGAIGALSDEERELLALVAEGYSDESIADRFGADADAIERDIADVFGKLEIETSPTDVRRALSVLASIRS